MFVKSSNTKHCFTEAMLFFLKIVIGHVGTKHRNAK